MNKSFDNVYFEYLEYIENRQKAQSKKNLKENFDSKILPYWKDYNINEITKIDYVKWQNEIEKYNYSNNYKTNLHYLMSGFLEYCVKYHNLEYNVCRVVGNFKKKNEHKKATFYTLKEFKHFIKHIDNDIYKQFFNLMFYTGTRPGEAMALKFSDINNKMLSINKTISEHCINGKRVVGTPKTYTSNREIEIDRFLFKDLLKLKKLYLKKYNNKNYDYFVFGGLKPLSPSTINRYKLKACQKAQIKPITLHQFRHSHATLLVSKNMMINEVSRRLGHSDIAMTLNRYTHTNKEQEKRVIRTLNFLRLIS